MTVPLPLAGLKVVAIEQAVAAPFCTSRLADAGAQVIKIERPEGDFARGYDDVAAGQSSYFVWLNRGKQSIVIDLATVDGRSAIEVLIGDADVFVQNLKVGALAKLGLAPDILCARHPRLIACSISGYGEDGPMADRKAYDLLIQAESGLASVTGGEESPSRVGISIVDIATGATAHAAVLEALIGRGISGRGADIRISMFDVMADWLTVPLLHQEGGRPPRRLGLAHPSIAPYGVFECRDGTQMLIAVQNDREWRILADRLLGDPSLGADERFGTNVARTARRAETDALVANAFSAIAATDAAEMLHSAGIAFASLNDMSNLALHPSLRRIEVDTPNGPVRYPAPAPIIKGVDRPYGPVPSLGQHTANSP